MPVRGKRVSSTAKTIIFNVFSYFKRQSQKSKAIGPPRLMDKTAKATGYCARSVRRVVAEKRASDGAAFMSPAKWYKRDGKRIVVDDFDLEGIRCAVHEFYSDKKYPTLESLLAPFKERGLFDCEHVNLWKVLRKLDFKYKQVNDKRYVYEQPRIIVQRHKYLRRMMRNRREWRPVVYLDETWANARDSVENMWVEDDPVVSGGTIGGVRKPSRNGNRLIILHAGGKNGWVKSADLVFQSKKATGDYHDEMTAAHFEEWFHDSLLPNLQNSSLIVMDNAPYRVLTVYLPGTPFSPQDSLLFLGT